MKKLLIISGVVVVLLVINFLGPYNVFLDINESNALKEIITEEGTFQGNDVITIDYRGSDTYFVMTENGEGKQKNYIVMREYISMMNGHWKVFEETSRNHFF
ncbi:hypothetical protein [Guptibacillus algicola]|uniref:hypothetical protein n=1 Tax=Guptibacillus algicola TaxID=225844 RepID=UPI001CD2F814|nr:hypothetical protein [Alkalihalobacillus algicola]MCA0988433.1 hypothetical protein [Alkalihalobacillus algicola]